MNLTRTFAQSLIIIMALACGAMAASAQSYPTRSIHLLLGLPPGGAADVTARLLARGLEDKLGQPVVVENKPGSGGNLVAQLVAKSPPDGYTLLLAPDSLFVINPHLYASMPLDPFKDLIPVASVISNYYAFVVSSALPAKTLPDFIALAKRSNPPLLYASFGNGTQSHLGVEMLAADRAVQARPRALSRRRASWRRRGERRRQPLPRRWRRLSADTVWPVASARCCEPRADR